jgi:2-iminoacetate synthase
MFSTIVDKTATSISQLLLESSKHIEEAVRKAEAGSPLSIKDLATLIRLSDKPERDRVIAAAAKRTRKVHGNSIGLIAPLYIDNHCRNSCRYCGMRKENDQLQRSYIESRKQFREEVQILRGLGYHTAELVAGSVCLNIDTINDYIETMERFQIENTAFFFDTLEAAEYREICQHNPNITMVHWQETYIRHDYELYHPLETPKGNYERRLDAVEVAIKSGLNKYAIGILFGLAEPTLDVLLCIAHGYYLTDTLGKAPTALGIVRLQPSSGAEIVEMPYQVDEQLHLFLTAILRLAFPEADIIVTSRETPEQIQALLRVAATFTNATCTTVPGGYADDVKPGLQRNGQFFHGSPTYAQIKILIEQIGLELDTTRPLGKTTYKNKRVA